MNVAFFLTPKSEVVWISIDTSMAQAFKRMEESGYTALPVLDLEGRYAGTLTEGDLLRYLMHSGRDASVGGTEHVRMSEVPMRAKNAAVDIDAAVEQLFERAIEQNFVPVQDSRGAFVGIVRRREILSYSAGLVRERRGH
jgi:CBS domain-containing protein